MALVKQISKILNDSAKNALGKNATLTNADTSTVVALGNKIAEYDAYEQWYKEIVNRIAQTVYFVRSYRGQNRTVLWDEHEYGAFVQRVYYEMPETVDDQAWNIPNSSDQYIQSSPYDVQTTVKASALIFGGQGVWSVEIVRPVEQIKTAFLSEQEMMSFIDGIYIVIENRYQLDVENLCNLTVNTSIADSINNGLSRNLLAEYNTEHPDNKITTATAMKNMDFLKFATREIKNTIDFMGRLSTVFNGAQYETFTPPDRMVVEMLAHFTSSYDTYLQADTFHDEITALPNFEKVSYWQGSGKTFDFTSCSTIDITNADLITETNTTGTVKQSGIICFIHDIENCACFFGNRKTWELYNPRSDVMVHGEHARKGFAVDSHANSFVFYIADTTPAEAVATAN